jgi:hypothetical protein
MNHVDILKLAQETAVKLGIRIDDPALVLENMMPRIGTATVFSNEDYSLWIDRHYIAYTINFKPEIVYVFTDKVHVSEELRSVCKRMKFEKSANGLKTLMSVKAQLQLAEAGMRESGDERYFFDGTEGTN